MSKARDHKTSEQLLADKRRFDWMRKHVRGYSKRLNWPLSGKNRAQRAQLTRAFGNFRHTSFA